jgi:CRISPR/Cas system CMR subunit Cmr6 (Cas7 group RAMP superfamily)
MKTYKVKIRFITQYLQAKFTEDAKKELENYISKGIVKSEEDSWKVLLHEDEEGIYIPNIQIRNSLVNAGKEFKMKKKRSSMKVWVQSNIIIEPNKIRLNRMAPDEVLISYPARKDGQRVVLKHPAFNVGTEVEFTIKSLDSTMEDKAIKELVIMSGEMYGLGARRADMFGRFELVEFK